jgi:hypothetical protein
LLGRVFRQRGIAADAGQTVHACRRLLRLLLLPELLKHPGLLPQRGTALRGVVPHMQPTTAALQRPAAAHAAALAAAGVAAPS